MRRFSLRCVLRFVPTSIGFREFVTLAAAMLALQGLAVDAMIPALPTIVAALGVADPNRGQWVVTGYLVGLGAGQLVWGPLSDRFGRRPILIGGLALYVVSAVMTGLSHDFALFLTWRTIHGLAAASFVVIRSAARDQYSGVQMARVMSLTFVVYVISEVLAPTIGQALLLSAPWRSIFAVFASLCAIVGLWTLVRLPETLHPQFKADLTLHRVGAALRLVLGNRISLCYTLAMTALFAAVIAYVALIQQIFTVTFERPTLMPLTFAACSISMGAASFLNARIVGRFGTKRISQVALLIFVLISAVHVAVIALGLERMWAFALLQSLTMACFGIAYANIGAIAMEPLAAVAGIGASVQGFITTFGGSLLGTLIGSAFTASAMPLAAGSLCCGLACVALVLSAERGRWLGDDGTPVERPMSVTEQAAP